jgi:hypothetical protein
MQQGTIRFSSAHLHDTESTMAAKINTFTVKPNHQLLGSRWLEKLDWELTRFRNNMEGQRWQVCIIPCKRARGLQGERR